MRLNETDLTQIRVFMTIYTQDGLLADGSDADHPVAALSGSSAAELQISKNGAAFVDRGATVGVSLNHVGDGLYYVQGVTADADARGQIHYKFKRWTGGVGGTGWRTAIGYNMVGDVRALDWADILGSTAVQTFGNTTIGALNSLSAAAITSVWKWTIEGSKKVDQMMRVWNSIIRGNGLVPNTGNFDYKGEDDATSRWTGTVAAGVRTRASENGD